MKTTITTRHFELSESLKDRTEERLQKLHRYFDRILDARMVVSFEKNRYNAEAALTANGTPLASHAVAETDKAAIEQVLDKLEVQVRRHKDRLTKGKRRGFGEGHPGAEERVEETEAASESPFDETDLDGLVGVEAGDWSAVLSLAEAAAELRVSTLEVLGFTNVQTQRRTLLFKRRDGRIAVVDVHPA